MPITDRKETNIQGVPWKLDVELPSKRNALMTKQPAVGVVCIFWTEGVTKTTTKKQFKDTYGFYRHTVSTYDLSFELSPCSKHLTDVSIPLNELRLRYEISHDKFNHHLVSNTDKTNDMHRFGSQKVQTQTESNFHSISQEPIITSRTHITIRNLQPVVGKQNTFTVVFNSPAAAGAIHKAMHLTMS